MYFFGTDTNISSCLKCFNVVEFGSESYETINAFNSILALDSRIVVLALFNCISFVVYLPSWVS